MVGTVAAVLAAVTPAALEAVPAGATTLPPEGVIDTLVGGGTGVATGPALAAEFSDLEAVTTDGAGNRFVADANRVRKIDVGGTVSVYAGTGACGSSGDGGPAVAAELCNPTALTIAPDGALLVSDTGNDRIRRIDATTTVITTIAGGHRGSDGDGGPATSAGLDDPDGIAITPDGALVIADLHSRAVRRVDPTTGIISTIAGQTVGTFQGPATDAFLDVRSTAVDAAGRRYIGSRRGIRRVDPNTGTIETVAGVGVTGNSGDGGPATSAEVGYVDGMAFAPDGDLLFADWYQNVVRRIDAATGTITAVAGTGSAGYSGDGGPATAAALRDPSDVALDLAGNVYVADSGNGRIRRVDAATGVITTYAGNGSNTYPTGDGFLATSAAVPNPTSVEVTAAGDLLVASSNRLRRIDATTGIITTAAGGANQAAYAGPALGASLRTPKSVVADAAGILYVAETDRHVIRRVDTATGQISTLAGTGFAGFSGDGGPAASAQLFSPMGLALSPDESTLAVADRFNDRVRTIDLAAGVITTVAGTGTPAPITDPIDVSYGVDGTLYAADYDGDRVRALDPGVSSTIVAGGGSVLGDGGPATSAAVDGPSGVTAVPGAVLVAATNQHRIRSVDATTGTITTIARTGLSGFSGDGGPATGARLNRPADVARDSGGTLYVADTWNHRIRRIDGSTGIITTVAGTGVQGFGGDGGPATDADLNLPGDVEVTADGDLLVTDSENDRVRRIDHTTGTITTIAGGTTGGPLAQMDLQPVDLAVTSAGDLVFRSDTRIYRADLAGTTTAIGGTGESGYSGDGGPALEAQIGATSGNGVAVAPDGTVVLGTANPYRLREIDPGGTITTTAGADGSPTGGPSTSVLFFPAELTVEADGTVLVSEFKGSTLWALDVGGTIGTRVTGQSFRALDTGPDGSTYASAGNQVVRYPPGSATPIVVAGTGSTGFTGDDGPATAATFNDIRGIEVASSGDVTIVDTGNDRLRSVDATSGTVTTIAGGGDGPGPVDDVILHHPDSATPLPGGDIAISDDHGLRLVDVDAGTIATVDPTNATGMATDTAGNLFLAAGTEVRRRDATTGTVTTIAGTGVTGSSGDGGPATAATLVASGVAVDGGGNVFVADKWGHRIRRIDAATGIITSVAGSGSSAYSGDGGPATAAGIDPRDVAVLPGGSLVISDHGNQRVRRVDAATGIITTIVGDGLAAPGGDGGPATSARVDDPLGVASDSAGNAFIADSGNDRIRRIDAATAIITTVAGRYTGGFSGDGGPATSAQLDKPIDIAVDGAGDLVIVDADNDRVRVVGGGPVLPVPVPVVSKLTPNAGLSTGGGTVTITGTDLTGATGVSFGATPANAFTVDSATQITATIPPHAAGYVVVSVTTPGGTSEATPFTTWFLFQDPAQPTVTKLTPNRGLSAGGTTVTITGTNLTGATEVTFGGVPAPAFTVLSANQISVTTPPHADGYVEVVVTNPAGTSEATPLTTWYRYQTDPPTISKLTPNHGPTTGATTVVITGTNFTGTTRVSFGATNSPSFTVDSPTQITATAPPGPTGLVNVSVNKPAGTSDNVPFVSWYRYE